MPSIADIKTVLIAKEVKKRQLNTPANVFADCFPKQLDFAFSDAKRKVLCCDRRAGKSTITVLMMIDQAMKNPNAKFLYCGQTKEGVENGIWENILSTAIRRFNVKVVPTAYKLQLKFPNGSKIYMLGLDATPKQKERLRGQKYQMVVIDECQSFTQDLNSIIDSVVDMTLAENQKAKLIVMGTPGENLGQNFWWQLNKPDSEKLKQEGWEKFQWSWRDNTTEPIAGGGKICENIQAEMDYKIALNPLVVNTPSFRREYLGEWVIDDETIIYRYSETYNRFFDLDPKFWIDCSYILGLDLGYYDATAFVICAYNKRYDGNLYVLTSHKKSHLTISDVADEIDYLRSKFNFKYMVVDAANVQAVEEMKQRRGIPLIAAEKQGKEAHIAVLNSDFIVGNIKIEAVNNKSLVEELQTLIWDQKVLNTSGKHREDSKKENHLTDALLYAHHFSRHYWFKESNRPQYLSEHEQHVLDLEKKLGMHKKYASTGNWHKQQTNWNKDDQY